MRSSRLPLLALLPILGGAPAEAQQAATAPPTAPPATRVAVPRAALVARLDSITEAWRRELPVAGATVAVVRGNDTLLLRGVGERDRERKLPATPGTVYRIGSITKQFTSAAIMQLVDSGRLALTDPLTKYLPQYPQWSEVTVRHLLNHTSGIPSYTTSEAFRSRGADAMTPAQIVATVEGDTADFAPGTQFRYNNTGYALLGMILERVTGRPYAAYMGERFFTPLGMRSAVYCPSGPAGDTHAAGYDARDGAIVPTRFLHMSQPYAAGALCMSVPDYLRWQAALTTGRVVRPATLARMATPDTLRTGAKTSYGFGLVSGLAGGHRMIWHNGGVNGFTTQGVWFPDDSLRVAVFANAVGANPERLAANLAAAVLGLPLVAPPKPLVAVPLAADSAPRYAGTYELTRPDGRPLVLHVITEGAGLVAQAEGPGQGKIPLVHLGADTFGAEFDPTLRLTILFENGRATRARLRQRGATLEGARRP